MMPRPVVAALKGAAARQRKRVGEELFRIKAGIPCSGHSANFLVACYQHRANGRPK